MTLFPEGGLIFIPFKAEALAYKAKHCRALPPVLTQTAQPEEATYILSGMPERCLHEQSPALSEKRLFSVS